MGRVLVDIHHLEALLKDPNNKPAIKQLKRDIELSEDSIQLVWGIEDVHYVANDDEDIGESKANVLSDEEARDILATMDSRHDANYGIGWDTIRVYVSDVLSDRIEGCIMIIEEK